MWEETTTGNVDGTGTLTQRPSAKPDLAYWHLGKSRHDKEYRFLGQLAETERFGGGACRILDGCLRHVVLLHFRNMGLQQVIVEATTA